MRRVLFCLLIGWVTVQFPSGGWLGITIQDLTPQMAARLGIRNREGVFVARVQFGSPAGKAGVAQGDVIVSYNGKKISNAEDLKREVSQTAPGERIALIVIRNRREKKIEIAVGSPPRRGV
ncbi:MAG: PDZ domain-containing protein [Nitrospiria bacterium]